MDLTVLKSCTLCPRNCKVDRLSGKTGFCGANDKLYLARAALHFWEEPCISGEAGSGTVFFQAVICGVYIAKTRKYHAWMQEKK